MPRPLGDKKREGDNRYDTSARRQAQEQGRQLWSQRRDSTRYSRGLKVRRKQGVSRRKSGVNRVLVLTKIL